LQTLIICAFGGSNCTKGEGIIAKFNASEEPYNLAIKLTSLQGSFIQAVSALNFANALWTKPAIYGISIFSIRHLIFLDSLIFIRFLQYKIKT
jgi:hypothetical protein